MVDVVSPVDHKQLKLLLLKMSYQAGALELKNRELLESTSALI